jgi:hypothetical protein
MYVCTYLCLHACMYVCMYQCMYVRMYVCLCACMYVCMYLCMYACMYVCMYVCMGTSRMYIFSIHSYIRVLFIGTVKFSNDDEDTGDIVCAYFYSLSNHSLTSSYFYHSLSHPFRHTKLTHNNPLTQSILFLLHSLNLLFISLLLFFFIIFLPRKHPLIQFSSLFNQQSLLMLSLSFEAASRPTKPAR